MIKRITTLFLAAIVLSMIVVQPFSFASAVPDFSYPSSGKNGNSMTCELSFAVPYWIVGILGPKAKKTQWVAAGATIDKNVVRFSAENLGQFLLLDGTGAIIDESNMDEKSEEALSGLLTFLDVLFVAIALYTATRTSTSFLTFGISEIAYLAIAGATYAITIFGMTRCQPMILNSDYAHFFSANLPVTNTISRDILPNAQFYTSYWDLTVDSVTHFDVGANVTQEESFAKGTILKIPDDTSLFVLPKAGPNFTNNKDIINDDGFFTTVSGATLVDNGCTAKIKVDIEALEDGVAFNDDAWIEIDPHPSTRYPPDYDLILESSVVWENNLRDVSKKNSLTGGSYANDRYDSTKKELEVDSGTHKVQYFVRQLISENKNEMAHNFIINDSKPPVGSVTPLNDLEPVLPGGAIIPPGYEELIKNATKSYKDPCILNDTLTKTTNLDSIIDINTGLIPTGNHSVTVTVKDSHGNTATPTVHVIVRDTIPPEVLPVSAIGIKVPVGSPGFDAGDLTPPPVFDMATFQPIVECKINDDACEGKILPVNSTTTVTWIVFDSSGNNSTLTQDVLIKDRNNSPIAVGGNVTVAVNQVTNIKLNYTDADSNDPIEFFLTSHPTLGSLVQNNTDIFKQRLSITGILPNPTDVLLHNNNIFVSDSSQKRIIQLNHFGDVENIFDTSPYSPDTFVAENPWNENPPNIIKILDFGGDGTVESSSSTQLLVKYSITGDDQLTLLGTIDLSSLNLVNSTTGYEQKNVIPPNFNTDSVPEGQVFVDEKNDGRAIFYPGPGEVNYTPTFTPSNTILVPGAYGVDNHRPSLTPSSAIITDWDAKKITINTSPVVPSFSGSETYQVDISSLFDDPDLLPDGTNGPEIPRLIDPIGIIPSDRNLPVLPYWNLASFGGGTAGSIEVQDTSDKWNGVITNDAAVHWMFGNNGFPTIGSPEGFSSIFLGENPAVRSWNTTEPITLKSISLELLHKQENKVRCGKINTNQNACRDHENPDGYPHGTTQAVWIQKLKTFEQASIISEFKVYAKNIDTGIWELVALHKPTTETVTSYPSLEGHETGLLGFPTLQYPKKWTSGIHRDNCGFDTGSGSPQNEKCDYKLTYYSSTKEFINVFPIKAQEFRFEANSGGANPGIVELDGYDIFQPHSATTPMKRHKILDYPPHSISVFDAVNGRMVDIDLGKPSQTSAERVDRHQFFGVNFVDIQDLDVDSEGNMFVIDDDFIYKYDLSGELLKRFNHEKLWAKETIGHQIFIDKDDILHVTMQDSEVFPSIPPDVFSSFVNAQCPGPGSCAPGPNNCASDAIWNDTLGECQECGDDGFFNPATQLCDAPDALNVKFNSTLAQQGDIRPIFVNDTGKLVYDDDGDVFSQGNQTIRKFSLSTDSNNRLLFTPTAIITSSCTETTPIMISSTESVDPCKVFDSAIDSNNNYFLLTPHFVWQYDNDGTFNTKVPKIALDFGFRLEIDKFDNFYIINGSSNGSNPTMAKFASNGDLLALLNTTELLKNFSINVTSNANLEPPDPNNLRITSGSDPLIPGTSLFYVSEGPPLDRIHLFESNIIYSNGTVDYISNVTGNDVFSFKVSDLIDTSSAASVFINVTADTSGPSFSFNCEVLNCSNWPTTQVSLTQNTKPELLAEDFAGLAGSVTDVKKQHQNLYYQRTGSEMPEKMLPILRENVISVLNKNIDSVEAQKTAIQQMYNPKHSIVYPLLLEADNHNLVQSLDYPIIKKDKNIRTLLADVKPNIVHDSIFSESSYSFVPSPTFIQQTNQSCLPDVVLEASTIEGLHTDEIDFLRAVEFVEVIDDFDPNPTISFDIPEFLQKGQNVITITVTDASGNESMCDWNVFVKDTTPPKLTIEQVTKDVEGVLTPVSIEEFGTPIIEDFDPLATAELVNPPSEFPPGHSEVTWFASDTSGNQATIQQTVFIFDGTPPEITPQNDIIIEAINGYANPINYSIPNATDISGIKLMPLPEPVILANMFSADDLSILPFAQITNLGEMLAPVICNPASGTTFTVGSIQVLCIATDNAFNSQTEGFYVIIHAFDDDGDNIANFVDAADDVFSDEFNDFEQEGETSGSIITRGNQTLSVVDAFSPDVGIFVSSKMQSLNINDDQDCVDNSQDPPLLLTGIKGDGVEDLCYDENEIIKEGLMELVDEDEIDGLDNDGDKLIDEDPAFVVGTQEAIVTACEESATIILGEGDAANITCGSVTIEVLSGPIEIEFASKIIVATTTLDAGEKLTFDPNTFTFTAGPNTDTIIFVGDEEYHITGGETLHIYQLVEIDIKPGNAENKINLKSKGVIPVAILSTSEFDATTVDPQSIMLGDSFTTISHKGHIKGVNRDGMNDLLVHFDTQQIQLEAETTSVCLIGIPFERLPIIGCDSVVPIENNSPKQVENAKVDFSSDTKVIPNDEPPKGKESNKNK